MSTISTIYSSFVVCDMVNGDKNLAADTVFPNREAALEACRALSAQPPVSIGSMVHKSNYVVISLYEYIEEQRSIARSDGVFEGREQAEQNFNEREK